MGTSPPVTLNTEENGDKKILISLAATLQLCRSIRYGSFDTTNTWLQHGNDYNGWNIAMSLDYQKSQGDKDRDSDEITVGAPGWQFYANGNWQFKKEWSLDGQYFWIGDRHWADNDSRSPAGVNIANDYPMEERAIWAEMRMHF